MKALDLAGHIVQRYLDYDASLTNVELQRLLYICQVVSLVEDNKPLFEEPVLARKFGPVVKSVYDVYHYNAGLDLVQAEDYNPFVPVPKFVDDLVDKMFTTKELRILTNRESGAWYKTITEGKSVILRADMISLDKEILEYL